MLIRVGDPDVSESVHLSDFPVADSTLIDANLSASVALSRRLVELGRAARAESKLKIRQPLARALVAAAGWNEMDLEIRSHIQDELNVLRLDPLTDESDGLVSVTVKANFRSIGARYGSAVQAIASAIVAADAPELVRSLRRDGLYALPYGEGIAQLQLEDLVITESPKAGWSVVSHSGESVALDLSLTPELIEAGLAREVIRAIQEQRKNSGFDISDRIHVLWNGGPDLEMAISTYSEQIADEVLALSIVRDDSLPTSDSEIGLALLLTKT